MAGVVDEVIKLVVLEELDVLDVLDTALDCVVVLVEDIMLEDEPVLEDVGVLCTDLSLMLK